MHEEIEVIDSFSKLPRFMLVTGEGERRLELRTIAPWIQDITEPMSGQCVCWKVRSLGLRKRPGELLGSQFVP